MSVDIDTNEIRRVAQKIQNIAFSVDDLSSVDLSSILNELEDGFEGEAANALREVLSELKHDIWRLGEGLAGIKAELMTYAARIDAVDEHAADSIIAK